MNGQKEVARKYSTGMAIGTIAVVALVADFAVPDMNFIDADGVEI